MNRKTFGHNNINKSTQEKWYKNISLRRKGNYIKFRLLNNLFIFIFKWIIMGIKLLRF